MMMCADVMSYPQVDFSSQSLGEARQNDGGKGSNRIWKEKENPLPESCMRQKLQLFNLWGPC